MSTRSSLSSQKYVDSAAGLKVLFFVAILAVIVGVGLRLYFNPARIKVLLEQAVGSDGERIGLKFQSARLSLAKGALPQVAVEVTGIEINPAHECRSEPSVRIARLFLPLDLTRLLQLKLSLGTISSEDILVDLDALKTRCPSKAVKAPRGSANGNRQLAVAPATASASGAGAMAQAAPSDLEVAPWWSLEQAEAIRQRVEGVDFSRVTVFFEEATKKVYLESFTAEPGEKAGAVRLETRLVIPPELTYDEKLPVLKIDAVAEPTAAQVNVRAGLSEGNLVVKGRLTAAAGGYLDADLQAAVDNVPLSTLVPLISKSGVIKGAFRPRFLWMNCQASIQGRFQGLFVENPLKLSECEIEGKGAKIHIGEAIRQPSGAWQPFVVKMSNVDLAQLLDTFDSKSLDGVLSEYGRFDGEVKVSAQDVAELTGDISGAVLRFSNRSERAEQSLKRVHTTLARRDGRLSGEIDAVDIENGAFEGRFAFTLAQNHNEGSFQLHLKQLQFNEAVQKVLVGGEFGVLQGEFAGQFAGGRLEQGSGKLSLSGVQSKDFRLREASLQIEATKERDGMRVLMRSPLIELRRESDFFVGLSQIFFTHQFADEWVRVDEPQIRGKLLRFPSSEEGSYRWEAFQASLENKKIRLSSAGKITRERDLEGWLSVDFPSLRQLKWQLGGTFQKPELRADSRNLLELKNKNLIDDARLGLMTKKSARQ